MSSLARKNTVTGLADSFLHKLRQNELQAMLGWFITTVATLSSVVGWLNNQPFNVFLGGCLAVGLWLVVRSSHLIGISESTLHLLRESRSGKAGHSHRNHHHPNVRELMLEDAAFQELELFRRLVLGISTLFIVLVYTFSVLYLVPDASWQVFLLLIIAIFGLGLGLDKGNGLIIVLATIATYLVLSMNQAAFFSLTALIIFTMMMWHYAWKARNWIFYLFIVFASYFSLIRWINSFTLPGDSSAFLPLIDWSLERVLIMTGLVLFGFCFALPFVGWRREAGEREQIRTILFTNAIISTLLMAWQIDFLSIFSWEAAFTCTMFIAAVLGYGAWLQHERYSYAKYYFIISIASLILFIIFYLDSLLISLLWFMVSVVLLTVGFVMRSYTARVAGLLILALSLLYYLFNVASTPPLPINSFLLHERVWLGVTLSIFLPVLAIWYNDLETKGGEKSLVPYITVTLNLSTFFILFTLIHGELAPPSETVGWFLLGVAAISYARWQNFQLLQMAGLGVAITSFLKFFLVDSFEFSVVGQLTAFILFGLIIAFLGTIGVRYREKVVAYFSFHS